MPSSTRFSRSLLWPFTAARKKSESPDGPGVQVLRRTIEHESPVSDCRSPVWPCRREDLQKIASCLHKGRSWGVPGLALQKSKRLTSDIASSRKGKQAGPLMMHEVVLTMTWKERGRGGRCAQLKAGASASARDACVWCAAVQVSGRPWQKMNSAPWPICATTLANKPARCSFSVLRSPSSIPWLRWCLGRTGERDDTAGEMRLCSRRNHTVSVTMAQARGGAQCLADVCVLAPVRCAVIHLSCCHTCDHRRPAGNQRARSNSSNTHDQGDPFNARSREQESSAG